MALGSVVLYVQTMKYLRKISCVGKMGRSVHAASISIPHGGECTIYRIPSCCQSVHADDDNLKTSRGPVMYREGLYSSV
jgi:hypothetical protein